MALTALSKVEIAPNRTEAIPILPLVDTTLVTLPFPRRTLSLLSLTFSRTGPDCGTLRPANVISTSYSYNEADLSPAYESRQCSEYAKLGLMGVTVVYSSGDNGVAGSDGFCLKPDGRSALFSFPSHICLLTLECSDF